MPKLNLTTTEKLLLTLVIILAFGLGMLIAAGLLSTMENINN